MRLARSHSILTNVGGPLGMARGSPGSGLACWAYACVCRSIKSSSIQPPETGPTTAPASHSAMVDPTGRGRAPRTHRSGQQHAAAPLRASPARCAALSRPGFPWVFSGLVDSRRSGYHSIHANMASPIAAAAAPAHTGIQPAPAPSAEGLAARNASGCVGMSNITVSWTRGSWISVSAASRGYRRCISLCEQNLMKNSHCA